MSCEYCGINEEECGVCSLVPDDIFCPHGLVKGAKCYDCVSEELATAKKENSRLVIELGNKSASLKGIMDRWEEAEAEITTLRAKVAAMQGVVNAVARFSNGLVGYRTEEIVAAYRKYKEVVR